MNNLVTLTVVSRVDLTRVLIPIIDKVFSYIGVFNTYMNHAYIN